MTSILKKVYIDKLNDIVNKYSNAYHRTLKMKPNDVKTTTYIDFDIENNDKHTKFKVGDHVRISKLKKKKKNVKGYFPNWSEEVFVIKRVKNSVLWTYVIEDLNSEKSVGVFYEKELQKANQNLELKKQ